MKVIRFLKDGYIRFSYMSKLGFTKYMPDKRFLAVKYKMKFKNELGFKFPITFNEKLQWLKLYDRNPEYTVMVDKHLVKDYVAKKIGQEYIIPTIGVWNDENEIEFDELPEQFVLKCNHNSGLGMYICRDKSKMDIPKVKKGLRKGLKQNYYLTGREWPYKNVERKIIAEKYMSDGSGDLIDYTIKDGVFVSDGSLGDAEISMYVDGECVGTTTIHVVLPDSIAFSRKSTTVPLGATIELNVSAKYGHNNVAFNDGDIEFTVADESVGTVSGNKFTAAESGTGTTVTAVVKGTKPAVSATMEIKLGKGSEVIFDFEKGNIGADLKNWRLGDHNNGSVIASEISIVNSETGKVHSGNSAMAFRYKMDEALHGTEFWAGNSLIWCGESIELKNATNISFWMYIPEDATHLAMHSTLFKHDADGKMNGWMSPEIMTYTDNDGMEYSGWHHINIPVNSDVAYIEDNKAQVGKTFNGSQFKYKANCFLKFYAVNIESWKNSETNYAGDFTFYIDDVTVDYSDAVQDCEEPVFSGMTYAVEGMSDAAQLNGQTVTEKVIDFAALVEEDMTNENNASGLDAATATAYIDGVEVDCKYADGKIKISSAELTDGVHTIRMGICDKVGNYAETKRQITVQSGDNDASVRVKPQDETLNYILNDAVYWVDVEADAVENVKSVNAKLDLDSMNNWELDHIDVLHGFDCEYSFETAAEKAENILTIKFTRNDEYLSETGTAVLASIPIRVWDYVGSDDHKHNNAVEAWKCNYVCAPALSIDVDTEMGVVEYLNDTKHTFSSKDIHTLGVSYTYGLRMRDFDKSYYSAHSYHVHTAKAIDNKKATCTEAGYENRTYCETCASPVAWGTTIPATGHTFAVVEGVLKCECGQTYTGVWSDGKEYTDGITKSGWLDDSYYKDGIKFIGVKLVDGFYYDFGKDGKCTGQKKYTGLFYDEIVNAYRYAKGGELYGGWIKIAPITNMILARLLTPEAFGAVATITMIISFAEIFMDAGFQKYIIQHEFKDDKEMNESTNVAFWTNLLISSIVISAIFIWRDFIAEIVGSPELGNSISLASVLILVTAFSSIQMARYKRDLDFKSLFYARIVTALIPLVITVPLAFVLRSYWALLIGTFASQILNAIILSYNSKWKPSLYYSFTLLRRMFSFSAWTLTESLAIWLTNYIVLMALQAVC